MRLEPVYLFDLDGTLVDSVYQHVLAWKEALDGRRDRAFGLAHPPQDRNERRLIHESVVARDRAGDQRGTGK